MGLPFVGYDLRFRRDLVPDADLQAGVRLANLQHPGRTP